jgi:hypothetical protein
VSLLTVALIRDPNGFYVTSALHVLATLIFVRPRWLWLGGITQEEIDGIFVSPNGWSFPLRLVKLLISSCSKVVNLVLVHIIVMSCLQIIHFMVVLFAYLLLDDGPKHPPLWIIYPSQVCLLLSVYYYFTSPVNKPLPTPTGLVWPHPEVKRSPTDKRKERLSYVFRKCARNSNKTITNVRS